MGAIGTMLVTIGAGALLGRRFERVRQTATETAERRVLRRSEARSWALVENASDVVAVVGVDGIIRYVGPAVERLLSRPPERLIGHDLFDFFHPDDRFFAQTALGGTAARPGVAPPIEVRLSHSDGSWRWFEVAANNRLSDPGINGIVFSARDVNDRKRADTAQRATEDRYRDLVDRGEGLIRSHQLDGILLTVNPAAARSFGYTADSHAG